MNILLDFQVSTERFFCGFKIFLDCFNVWKILIFYPFEKIAHLTFFLLLDCRTAMCIEDEKAIFKDYPKWFVKSLLQF